jgi:diadenosine tetraphosphate (Ap4A) HIT family hydrolase
MTTDLERALNEQQVPWTEIEFRSTDFWVFRDAYPVTQGHLLFVPTQKQSHNLWACFKAAYKFGYEGVESGRWSSFNIGQNVGEDAGQTVMYPHVHMIPRRKGDMEDPRGGVRHVIPEKGNYKNAN